MVEAIAVRREGDSDVQASLDVDPSIRLRTKNDLS